MTIKKHKNVYREACETYCFKISFFQQDLKTKTKPNLQNYYQRQKSRQVDVFWITFDRNKVEICDFQRLIGKTQDHVFVSKIFFEEKLRRFVFKRIAERLRWFSESCHRSILILLHIWNHHRKLSQFIYRVGQKFCNIFYFTYI